MATTGGGGRGLGRGTPLDDATKAAIMDCLPDLDSLKILFSEAVKAQPEQPVEVANENSDDGGQDDEDEPELQIDGLLTLASAIKLLQRVREELCARINGVSPGFHDWTQRIFEDTLADAITELEYTQRDAFKFKYLYDNGIGSVIEVVYRLTQP